MRLFQIQIEKVNDYSWTLNHESYHDTYAKEREEGARRKVEREASLQAIGIIGDSVNGIVVTDEQLVNLNIAKIPFVIEREVKLPEFPTEPTAMMAKFVQVANKLMSMPGMQSINPMPVLNERLQVHMPGQALATYNELLLMEDACTDQLQKKLDDNWRIIAACPQPDSRRPDYILGRYNPARTSADFSGDAERA